MRSTVTLKQYLAEIRHEADIMDKSDLFPNGLMYKWIHKDIIETILKLDGIINKIYKANATIAVANNAGYYDATASHVAGNVSVTGFSGLTPDAWIGGSILTVVSNVFYSAQITDNDATTITISVGTDLPVMSGDPVFLTANNSGTYIDVSSLSLIEFNEPFWEIIDSSGVPIEMMDQKQARGISSIPEYDENVYWHRVGQKVYFVLGLSATLSGNITVGYYQLPTEATTLTAYIDFPLEYHNLAQQLTLVRVFKKLEMMDKARLHESELENKYRKILEMSLNQTADKQSGERF
jgi:hypothetical protein